jgi:hypothetical protein
MSSRRPAKLLPIKFNLRSALAPDPAGRVYRYNAQLTMANPQRYSSSIHGNKQYTLENLLVGDYVSTTGNGRIMKIVSITTAAPFNATVVVEDEYRLNQIQDSTGDNTPWIESQNGIVFEVRDGKPVLFPYTEYSTSVIGFVKDYGAELFSRFNYLRQHILVDQYQAGHTFVTDDLITWTSGSGWSLVQENDKYIGTTTTINATNTSIADQLIELNQGYTGPPLNIDSGIVVNRGPGEDNLFFGWDESENVFTVGTGTFTGANTGELTLADAAVRFGDTEVSGTLDVAGQTILASATIQDLVDNRIVVAGVAGLLETDPNLTWNGNTLTVSGTGVAFTTGKVSIGNTTNSSINHTMYILYGTTTDSTLTELFLDDVNSRITLDNNTTMMFEADIVGRDSTGAKHCAFKLSGVIDNTNGSTILINNVSETIVAETVEAWNAVAQADDTNDTLVIKVTGEDTTIIKWTAFVKTISITH